ncbi:MAG: radical SAM family heme chaperone HemW [Thermodesulfobacteriaceae bacterium]|nr:radical SAM family heme chaperone HemW [Thermodesulfobacteriaceae bacterium]
MARVKKEKIALYLHFPFCLKKCPYCNFYSLTLPFSEKDYAKALTQELLLLKSFLKDLIRNYEVVTFYAGGGTPSLFSPSFFENLINFITKHFNFSPIELTIEANPETLFLDKLKAYRKIGLNRISLGVQSLCRRGLKFLERVHTPQKTYQVLKWIIKANFTNFSLDFIFGWKGQGEKTLKREIIKALDYNPPHLSFYELTLESNTPFFELYGLEKPWISETKIIKLYKLIEDTLNSYGYERYEISNYALKGFESLHNLFYWKIKPYLGLGPSAVSRIGFLRWKNPPNLNLYYQLLLEENRLPLEIIETLDRTSLAKEYILMGLRLKEGISLKVLKNKYKTKILPEALKKLIQEKLIKIEGNKVVLTFEGKLKHNQVVAFLWDHLEFLKS